MIRRTVAILVGSVIGVAVIAVAAQQKPQQAKPAFEVAEATIPELQEALRSGKVTSRGLVEAYLARIRAYDGQGPKLNAIIVINRNAVRDADAPPGQSALPPRDGEAVAESRRARDGDCAMPTARRRSRCRRSASPCASPPRRGRGAGHGVPLRLIVHAGAVRAIRQAVRRRQPGNSTICVCTVCVSMRLFSS